MESYLEEEELLQKRLEELENRYKQTLFSQDALVNVLEKEIIDDSKDDKNKKPIFKPLQEYKIENQQNKDQEIHEIIPEENSYGKSLDFNQKDLIQKKGFLKKVFSPLKNSNQNKNNLVKIENLKNPENNWPKKIVQGDFNTKMILEKEKKVPEIKAPELKAPEPKIDEIKKPDKNTYEIKEGTVLDPVLITRELTGEINKSNLGGSIKNVMIETSGLEIKKDLEINKEKLEKDIEETKEKKKIKSLTIENRPNDGQIKMCSEKIKKIKKEVSKALVGQDDIVEGLIMGLLCNAHVLVEGVPGIAKTLAIKTLASVIGCDVKRVQFTVDLLPTDIIGITTYTPEKGFEIIKGPIFTNFLIADEINRAPPKTQSALIEAMQEKQVSIGREKFMLSAPFFVMATENPIENAGVYPLPEAQIDRFLFKLIMHYPKFDEEMKVLDINMSNEKFESFGLTSVVTPEDIIEMQELVKKVYVDDSVKAYILSIVRKTRDRDFSMAEYISYGSSPRASIGLYIASKARALMDGRNYVIPEDVKKVSYNVLRHRLILSYKANIKKISEDAIVLDILNSVKVD